MLAVLSLFIASCVRHGGDPEGCRAFRACGACHSLSPGQHRTGPSLAGVFGRTGRHGRRLSPLLPGPQGGGVVWDEASLDPWISGPGRPFIPGNRMTFPGLKDDQARADLIAYLEQTAANETAAQGGAA